MPRKESRSRRNWRDTCSERYLVNYVLYEEFVTITSMIKVTSTRLDIRNGTCGVSKYKILQNKSVLECVPKNFHA